MKAFKIIFFMVMLFMISCKQESSDNEEYPVIEPGSYLPVYPGSWWKYQVDDSLIIIDSTSKYYILHNYILCYDNDEKPVYSEKYYVPYYYSAYNSPLGINGPIYRYDKIVRTLWPQGNTSWPILREEIGDRFTAIPVDNHTSVVETITVTSKYFNGQDSVLVMVGRPNLDVTEIHVQEFFKDIGLARDFIIDTIANDTTYRRVLIDYHISK
jgi:hypothetical protein